MSNQILVALSEEIDRDVHSTPNISHGFTSEDVMAAAALLHAIVMDIGAQKLLREVGQEEAIVLAREWGQTMHDQVKVMTGVDMYDYGANSNAQLTRR